jgi:hypothetical protein
MRVSRHGGGGGNVDCQISEAVEPIKILGDLDESRMSSKHGGR